VIDPLALPTHYLTTARNLDGILAAMQTAQAPQVFNRRFLESLDYKSSSDRLIINVLKALGFLSSDNKPTERYYEFLDQTQAGRVMADALKEAYTDLFEVHTRAQDLSKADLKNKLRTLSRGQFTEGVLDKMAMTFKALTKHADFEAADQHPGVGESAEADLIAEAEGGEEDDEGDDEGRELPGDGPGVRLGGLVYNIQIQLPESRDQAVYDALFRSLKTHLLR
jgi:hypothetical protein